jgi:hypothetical protein
MIKRKKYRKKRLRYIGSNVICVLKTFNVYSMLWGAGVAQSV